jgi:hypothetical protein
MKATSVLILVAATCFSPVYPPGAGGGFRAAAQGPEASRSPVANRDESRMEQLIVSKEREGLDALKTGDLERFGKLTADEAIFVDPHGAASKAQVMKNVAGFTLTDYQMEDVQFERIAAKTGLISYKITEKGVSHGREFTAQVYVSSIWAERKGSWVCLFSQETAVPHPAPAPPKP